MARVLIVNPNADRACGAAIDAAVAPLRRPGGPAIDVMSCADGPPAIYSWRDWHAAVGPLCRAIEAEEAALYVIACASDPGIEAAREVTARPVLGIFRCAVERAVGRFGVIAMASSSVARHALALRSVGAMDRLAGEIPLDVPMAALLDPVAARARLEAAGRSLVAGGAESVILGCTGMAGHRDALEQTLGVPVIEPCQAATRTALDRLSA